MTIFEAVVLAIVEGITEFLPVSSTGHMIIASSLMGIEADDFTKAFTISVQFGAILSVLALYWKRFLRSVNFYVKLFVAFIPAVVVGVLLGDWIDSLLENVVAVAIALILGGIVLVFIDRLFSADKADDITDPENIPYKNAFAIGVFQCIAVIPGVSRSAATIIGGLTQKLTRKAAAEFSFFLAIPTMAGAMFKKMVMDEIESGANKGLHPYELLLNNHDNMTAFIIGNVIAFIIAILAMRSFVGYLTKHGFKIFGYYRIIVGAIILILIAAGVDMQIL
ncbi:MAG TPA: undecaprenyl-diphosphate phosphatase [Chitinophagales bacterium]|nr:undecaprenyl-diphosphate phosphatase [Chitinophagales bacterium]HMU70871.1 undecaprenyl-diphosphate phosphatase [Chitinophagales bacterium]HMX04421.1 undecaprenyl-diphosphate phosphatase [Chitinophagales bacterium]HNA56990.1 undecaprenyl-diphosphate phosphatase [Chitinophagales bacterium]HNE46345.1 undecaprenyl-diphosphate phosphatase [Chitinophagales bacterium]